MIKWFQNQAGKMSGHVGTANLPFGYRVYYHQRVVRIRGVQTDCNGFPTQLYLTWVLKTPLKTFLHSLHFKISARYVYILTFMHTSLKSRPFIIAFTKHIYNTFNHRFNSVYLLNGCIRLEKQRIRSSAETGVPRCSNADFEVKWPGLFDNTSLTFQL